MTNLERRVAKLEAAISVTWDEEVEHSFWETIGALAAAFPETAASMSEAERLDTLSPVQHVAWRQRFSPAVELADVLGLYGLGVPTTALGYILVRSYIPGDENL